MFGNRMKQMIREADRIVSLKQDMDSLSWGRVQEIAKELQDGPSTQQVEELGRELAVIAQINLSMFSRMGVIPQTMWSTNQSAPAAANAAGIVVTDDESNPVILPSGMEVIEGGLVEAVLENPELATVPLNPVSPTPGSPAEDLLSNALAEESEFLDNPARSFDFDGEAQTQQPDETAEKEPPASASDLSARVSGHPTESLDGAASAEELQDLPKEESGKEEETGSRPDASPNPEDVSSENGTARKDDGGGKPSQQDSPGEQSSESAADGSVLTGGQFANFRHIYESRDGSLCVFKDEHGHLVSVRASRLA